MKNKIIAIILVTVLMLCFASCVVEETSRVPINTEYVAAYDSLETVHEYKWDWWHGDYVLTPVLKQVHHEEVYKVQYEITYSDGRTTMVWEEVSKSVYEEAQAKLEGR